ncbi:NAD(P)-binding protein [Panus rudis PR-1116 ss-1]|nr:NAD(P)-binding protein [Panus rudis PR-1116 ss-1]
MSSSNTSESGPLYLVTGASGFIGAHVLDELLRRGYRVRGTTRSASKAEQMKRDRSQYAHLLDFAFIDDLTRPGVFDEAVKGVDGILHVASPVKYDVTDVEKELLLPAIEGTKAILQAAKSEPGVKRLVLTSSFAAVFDVSQGPRPGWTYTSEHWNPITYDEAKAADAVQAYRGAKKYAELTAWDCVRNEKPHFDLVTICPPLVFGPLAHPISNLSELNESNRALWQIASGVDPLPTARVPAWVDVRDLAVAHVESLLRPEVSNRRFLVSSPEKFTYQRVADVIRAEFDWAKDKVTKGEEGAPLPETFDIDGTTASEALGFTYRKFRQSIVDTITQFKGIEARQGGA